jgi:hypothetical protein
LTQFTRLSLDHSRSQDGSLPRDQRAEAPVQDNTSNGDNEYNMLIWIDAVCINQSDNLEKSWQVAMMADIYRDAKETFVFLGPRSEFSDEAIEFFTRLSSIIVDLGYFGDSHDAFREGLEVAIRELRRQDIRENLVIVPRSMEDLVLSMMSRAGSDPNQRTLFDLYSAIMDRPWWQRTWSKCIGTSCM